jgi:hypothetical protein
MALNIAIEMAEVSVFIYDQTASDDHVPWDLILSIGIPEE